jgi:arabinogalactan endo-1,4-beta-galactosidase
MARRVRDAGMKLLLNFHYSDTWADPAKQHKPMSWAGLDFAGLTEKVRSYTRETLELFRDNGVLPDMVQIGNEAVDGMIWPDGRLWRDGRNNIAAFAALVNAGIDGVRDVDTTIKIMVHTINERDPNRWLTNLINAGVTRIDVFGLSYYPRWHGGPDSLERVANAFAVINRNNNIRLSVVEYSSHHREVNDIVFNLPENKRFGTFVWEPCDWDGDGLGRPLFDWRNRRRETNELIALYPEMSRDFGNDVTSEISGDARQAGARRPSANAFRVTAGGVIDYRSDMPGTVMVYTMRGRAVGRFDIRSPGRYDPARSLKTPLRPGAYIIAVESADGSRQAFVRRVSNMPN